MYHRIAGNDCRRNVYLGDHWLPPIGLRSPLTIEQFYKPVMSACKPVTNAVCWLGSDHCVVFMLYNNAQILNVLHAYTNCHHFLSSASLYIPTLD